MNCLQVFKKMHSLLDSLSFALSLNILITFLQIEFDEKEMRREIMIAIKNIHGIRFILRNFPFSLLSKI